MTNDEQAIRDLVESWMSATKAGDSRTVLGVMADDAIFMVCGREPFGKEVFAAASQGQQNFQIEGKSDIREVRVLGEWAYMRNFLTVTMTPKAGGKPVSRSGYTLTILRKQLDGRWVLFRDANLMPPPGA